MKIVTFYVKEKYLHVVDELTKYAVENDISISNAICRSIEYFIIEKGENHGNTISKNSKRN